jgi:alpha/beta superfamily hydrolase
MKSETLELEGPAGALEALLDRPADAPGAVGLVCHPHPLFQGSMHNKVAYTLARAFTDLGAIALRFNFRGVGKSVGDYAHGRGETEDALAAAEWLRAQYPQLPLWLAGFSFGAAVALGAAPRLKPDVLVTVAPPVERPGWPAFSHPHCPWLLLQGADDDVVDPQAVLAWANSLTPPPEIVRFPGVGHFFHGHLNELRSAVVERLPLIMQG